MNLAAVREATLAAGTARGALARFAEGRPSLTWEEGVTDLRRRRTSTAMTFPEGSPLDKFETTVRERWPWLDSDHDEEARTLPLGSATYFVTTDRCTVIKEGLESGPRSQGDPTSI